MKILLLIALLVSLQALSQDEGAVEDASQENIPELELPDEGEEAPVEEGVDEEPEVSSEKDPKLNDYFPDEKPAE